MVGKSCLSKVASTLCTFRVGDPGSSWQFVDNDGGCVKIFIKLKSTLSPHLLRTLYVPWVWRRFFRRLAFGPRGNDLSDSDRMCLDSIGFTIHQRRVDLAKAEIVLTFGFNWCHHRARERMSFGMWPKVPGRFQLPDQLIDHGPCQLCCC